MHRGGRLPVHSGDSRDLRDDCHRRNRSDARHASDRRWHRRNHLARQCDGTDIRDLRGLLKFLTGRNDTRW